MLRAWRESQEETKEMMAGEYHDYNLVFAGPCGLPTEQSSIDGALKRLIRENDLPPIVFHSFRHTSVTYKLRLNGGDIKAVQGNTGHAQSKMVSDVYSHILDEGRKHNAQLFEKEFYNPEAKTEDTPNPSGIDPAVLQRLLSNPETAAFLAMLAQKNGIRKHGGGKICCLRAILHRCTTRMTIALENRGDPLNRAIRKKPSVKKPALLAQLLALAAGERSAFI